MPPILRRAHPTAQIRVRGTRSFGILDHVFTDTSTRIRLFSRIFERPAKEVFSTALDDYDPVNFWLAIAMMPLQQTLRDSRMYSGAENTHSEPVAKRMNKFTILVL
jgi:hypothetical protein